MCKVTLFCQYINDIKHQNDKLFVISPKKIFSYCEIIIFGICKRIGSRIENNSFMAAKV